MTAPTDNAARSRSALTYLSLCSGIEAATVAWHSLGWRPWAFSEVDAFPSSVLAHHYPSVSNLGDMTRFQDWPDAAIDVLVGGTPCQSFSVAGLRKGLDDPRGNLMLTYGAIARRYRPRWLVWENVPGVLSSNGGRDFGTFLGLLGELGYGFAYRVLDAQYFGLAQRRKRVFVVGHLGDWRRAAAVLLERASLRGDPAPRREARESVAGDAGVCTKGRRWPADVTSALNASFGDKQGLEDQHALNGAELFVPVAHSLRASGFDASEDGTGRGTPLVPVAIHENQRGELTTNDTTGALGQGGGKPGQGYAAVAFTASEQANSFAWERDYAPTLRTGSGGTSGVGPAVAFAQNQLGEVRLGDVTNTLNTNSNASGRNTPLAHTGMQVRRLTPRECERLQGFPDDYTLVPHRGKPAADGPRYKALGNSMAVPVMRWIGERIAMVEGISCRA